MGTVWLLFVLCWGLLSQNTILSFATASTFFVTPHSHNDCHSRVPCLTINEYAQGDHLHGHDNITLFFLSGEHNLTVQVFEIVNKTSLTIVAASSQAKVILQLANETEIKVWNVHQVNIMDLKIISQSTGNACCVSAQCLSLSDIGFLLLTKFSIESCLLALQDKMNGIVSEFTANKSCILSAISQSNHKLAIRNSKFYYSILNVSDKFSSQFYTSNNVLCVEDSSMNSSFVTVHLQTQTVYLLSVINTSITSEHSYNSSETGIKVEVYNTSSIQIAITNSIFKQNNGVSVGVRIFSISGSSKESDITLKNVTFINNTNTSPEQGIVLVDNIYSLTIEDSFFIGNQGSSIQAFASDVTLSGSVVFRDNIAFQGGAISLRFSALILQSVNETNTNIVLSNNTATNVGGGIYIDQSLSSDPYTGSSCFYDVQGVSYTKLKQFTTNVTLVFVNNTATNGGVDIYGATPNSDCKICTKRAGLYYNSATLKGYIFITTSSLSSVSSDPQRVCLCDPFSQLMCADLSHIFHNIRRYPGEVFSLSLAVVGFEFGTVTGSVYAHLLPQENNFQSILGDGQHVQQVNHTAAGCVKLNFSVNSLNTKETIVLTANAIRNRSTKLKSRYYTDYLTQNYKQTSKIMLALLRQPVYIEVTLQGCPLGFQLTENGRCDCVTELMDYGITNCSIHHNTSFITRSGNQWIKWASDQNGILYTQCCPFTYCTHKSINISLNNTDKQCTSNRTGILCGSCLPNYSLAIGSSRCLDCSAAKYHTLLLIAFAAAGIALVLFIKILDLTVKAGTINGLIFYANSIWANQRALFPPLYQSSPPLQFLKTFIAWLNLDLGIETCFIQHLDEYWKTWLQFCPSLCTSG